MPDNPNEQKEGVRKLPDILASLSLANFSFIAIWDPLLNYTPAQAFMFEHAPPRAAYLAAFANVALLTLAFFGLIRLARFAARRFGTIGFLFGTLPCVLLVSLPAAKSFLRLVLNRDPFGDQWLIATIFLAALLLIAAVARHRFFALATAVLVTISPLIAIEAIISISKCWRDPTTFYPNGPLAARTLPDSRPRIIWIIFDELDYRLAFTDRIATTPLPELDRLRAESIFAENAASPGPDTIPSVPSLITGQPIDDFNVRSFTLPTIFSSAHAMGANVSVTGWYIPYCRMFSKDLANCSFHEWETELSGSGDTFGENLVAQFQSLYSYGVRTLWGKTPRARHRISMLHKMHEEALKNVTDPTLNLVFLHLPVPHPPHLYDRFTYTFPNRGFGSGDYYDSIVLADNYLGDIRQAMTDAGLWDSSTVLVTSDHPDRTSTILDGKSDWRIPFL